MLPYARTTKGFAELGAGIGGPGGRSVTAAWLWYWYVAVSGRLFGRVWRLLFRRGEIVSRGLSHEGVWRASQVENILEERPISPIPIAAVGMIPRKNFAARWRLLVSGCTEPCLHSPALQPRHLLDEAGLQQINKDVQKSLYHYNIVVQ